MRGGHKLLNHDRRLTCAILLSIFNYAQLLLLTFGKEKHMGWKASKEHESKGETTKIGPTHFDVYHTDDSGNRDQPHHTDLKISGSPHEPSMRDIHPPSDSSGSSGSDNSGK